MTIESRIKKLAELRKKHDVERDRLDEYIDQVDEMVL